MSSELGASDTVTNNPGSPSSMSGNASIAAAAVSGSTSLSTFEHPLTAATTAMLNINGANDDSAGFAVFYDYYGKMHAASQDPVLNIKTEKTLGADIWSPVAVTSPVIQPKLTNGDLAEVFVPGGALQTSKLTSALRRGDNKMDVKPLQNGHRYTNGEVQNGAEVHVNGIKEEIVQSPGPASSPRMNGILGSTAGSTPTSSVSPNDDQHAYSSPQLFATLSNPSNHVPSPYEPYPPQLSVVVSSPAQFTSSNLRGGGTGSLTLSGASGIYTVTSPSDSYFRDYYNDYGTTGGLATTRTLSGYDANPNDTSAFTDRYGRASGITNNYKTPSTIDLPSPDSGIGVEAIPTARDQANLQQGLEYSEICQTSLINEVNGSGSSGRSGNGSGTPAPQKTSRPWHDFGRQSDNDKIQIPKLFSSYGFRYYLESPISTSQRREDDRITYINKGQFYGITLEYIPDQDKPLKSQTVKSIVMLVFREEKSPEDEIKAWHFWHSRQHSVKQRILDADTKNSVGLVGCIEEVAHNAIAVYWNPLESAAKINVAVQCLSTDFSSQKGVKGLPLHIQIDTYDDPRDPNCAVAHRGYGQIKVFCDKGAERKTRDEERRAAKRKLTATGRKKLDEMYHSSCDRSEFYTMSDMTKPPVLFSPAEDLDKLTPMELQAFYHPTSDPTDHSGNGAEDNEHSLALNSEPTSSRVFIDPSSTCNNNSSAAFNQNPHPNGGTPTPPIASTPIRSNIMSNVAPKSSSRKNSTGSNSSTCSNNTMLKFHNTFPPDSDIKEKKEGVPLDHHNGVTNNSHGAADSIFSSSPSLSKRMRLVPPVSERLMLFVRQEPEDSFTPLHLVPPTTLGLLSALEEKYKISMGSVKNLYRKNHKGIVAKIDDEMLKHYCHEDSFILHVKPSDNEDAFDVTLTEFMECSS